MRETPDDPTPEVISRYSREQAIEDGTLVSLPQDIHAEYGLRLPTVLSYSLFCSLEEGGEGGDYRGRLHDLLTMFRLAAKGAPDGETFLSYEVILNGALTTVYAVIDGDGLTIMLPSDY